MSSSSTLTYPPEGFGAPKDRQGRATGATGLPAGTAVFSADDHISLAADIFYERFPDELKDQLLTLKKEQFNLRFQRATQQLEQTGRVRLVRREIARIKTILNEKAAAAAAAK